MSLSNPVYGPKSVFPAKTGFLENMILEILKVINKCMTTGLMGLVLSTMIVSARADDIKTLMGAGPYDGLSFTVTCAPNEYGATAHYVFQIQGITPNLPFIARMTASKGGITQSVEDPANGNGSFGPSASLAGGDGQYQVIISKAPRPGFTSATGKMTVSVTHHCLAANGGHTTLQSTTPQTIQITGPGPNPPPVASGVPGFTGALTHKASERRYTVECLTKKGVDTDRYRFRIKGATKKAPFNVKLTVRKGEGGEEIVEEVIDTNNTDNAFTDWVEVLGGNGLYALSVGKYSEAGTTHGSMSYSIKHECVAENGNRTQLKGPKKIP